MATVDPDSRFPSPRGGFIALRKAALSQVLLLMLTGASSSRAWDETTAATPKPPIAEEEFMRLFQSGSAIESRTVPAAVIHSALRWAQAESSLKHHLPDELVITDSIIEGDLKSLGLEVTAVEKLKAADRKGLLGWVGAEVIPLSLFIQQCELQGKVDFTTAIFEGDVSFQHSKFDQEATFQDAIFRKRGHFVGADFLGSVAFWGAVFEQRCSFAKGTFSKWAIFVETEFRDGENFAFVTFQGPVSFRNASLREIAHFDPRQDFAKHIDFDQAKFLDTLDMTQAEVIGTATFDGAVFSKDTFFIELNKAIPADDDKQRAMEFSGAAFGGRIYFQNSRLGKLSFRPSAQALGIEVKEQPNPSRQPVSPTTIAGRSVFSGLRVSDADFSEVEFRDYADFSAARFSKFVSLQGAVFEKESNFSYASFPPGAGGLLLNDVQFQKPVRLEWRQINGKLTIEGSDGWRQLEEAFKQSGELQGQNECSYRRQLAEAAEKEGWDKVPDEAAFWFWGYGLRPLRVVGWIMLLYLLFSALYFTQTGAMTGAGRWRTFWKRAGFALTFALRSSWNFSFGYQNARTNLFRFFTSLNSVGMKVMLIFLFKAVANVSPLLNDMLHKLVPL